LSCSEGSCVGIISTWSRNEQSVGAITPGSYNITGIIDSNNDGDLDDGEPTSSDYYPIRTVSIREGSSPVTLNNWQDADLNVGSTTEVPIPTVTINCSTASDCSDMTANGKTTTAVYYTGSTFVVSGQTTVTCVGGVCSGIIDSWVINGTTTPRTTILPFNYNLQVRIDTNSNGQFDESEPESFDYHPDTTIAVGSDVSNITVLDWRDEDPSVAPIPSFVIDFVDGNSRPRTVKSSAIGAFTFLKFRKIINVESC